MEEENIKEEWFKKIIHQVAEDELDDWDDTHYQECYASKNSDAEYWADYEAEGYDCSCQNPYKEKRVNVKELEKAITEFNAYATDLVNEEKNKGVKMNKVILLGRIRKIESKDKFTKLSVVTNTKYKGEQQSQWHDCVAFGKIAEIVDEYLDKGCMVNIIGHLSYWGGVISFEAYKSLTNSPFSSAPPLA